MSLITFMLLFIASIQLSFSDYNQSKVASQQIVRYIYNEFNSRESWLNIDTLNLEFRRTGDSTFMYKTEDKGSSTDVFEIDLKSKKATLNYEEITSVDENDGSINKLKFVYNVKYVDNKIFRLPNDDKKYFVYRYIAYLKSPNDYMNCLIYWSKEYGIILEKHLSMNTLIRNEYINNESKNLAIRHLGYYIFSDARFFNLKDWETIIKE
jgi:hypothetical protein